MYLDWVIFRVRQHVKYLLDGLDRMIVNPKEHVPFLPKLQQLSSK